MMQQINHEYQLIKEILRHHQKSLYDLKQGDLVYVNGTECLVILSLSDKFIARAKGRSKQAWFDKATGLGLYNPLYRASMNPLDNRNSSNS